MKIGIVGAGAIGTLLAHGFTRGGHEVSLVDLPARVAALRAAGGVTVIDPDGVATQASPALITSDIAAVGLQDVVFLATKAQDLPGLASKLPLLTQRVAPVVTVQNGIPWWYLHGLRPGTDERIPCLDPSGSLDRYIARDQIVGCVAYPAATVLADGRTRHVEGNAFPIGEAHGGTHERTVRIAGALTDAGFKSRILDDIRSELWLKAWGALSLNPVSALTRADLASICSHPLTRELVAKMMREAQDVAESFGATFRHTIDKRIEGAHAVGAHKTSMLQDVEQGRPLELDALMLAVLELAAIARRDTPTIRTVYACVALLDESLRSSRPETHAAQA